MSWLAQRLQGMAPSFMTRVWSLADRKLPRPAPPNTTSGMRLGADVLADSTDPEVQALGAAARADARRYHPVDS